MAPPTRAAAALLVLAACNPTETREFPPGVEPLEPVNDIGWPAATPTDPCPETIVLSNGVAEGTLYWAHGRGCVHAPLDATWAALRDGVVCADRFNVDYISVTCNVEPDYLCDPDCVPNTCDPLLCPAPCSYRIREEVYSIFTVWFEITWRHKPLSGTWEAPLTGGARYQITDGTTHIRTYLGSVLLAPHPDDAGITTLEFVRYVDADRTTPDDVSGGINLLFWSVKARVHGEPLPNPP